MVLAIPWTYFNITLGLQLEDTLAEIKARGEPLTIQQAIPEMPPRDENAAYVYEQAFRVFNMWEDARDDAVPGKLLSNLDREMSDAVNDYVSGETPSLDPPVRQWLMSEEVSDRLAAIQRASQMERCLFPVNWEDGYGALFPHMVLFRGAQRLVTARMMLAGRQGHTDEALQWCEVGLRMTEHVGQEPTLIAFLVRVAMQDILFGGAEQICGDLAIPPTTARHLRDMIAAEDLWEHFDRALLTERAFTLCMLQHPDALIATISDHPTLLWRLYPSLPAIPLRKNDQLTYLRLWDAQLAFTERRYREVAPIEDPTELLLHRLRWFAPATHDLFPLFSRAVIKREMGIAQLNQFQIALMLNVHRQVRGEYPETLDVLARVVNWQPPHDIFSGEAFHYRREGDGYILWSLASDLDNDGGEGPDAPGRDWEDCDIVWRAQR